MGTMPKRMGRGLEVSRADPGLEEGHTGSPGGTMRHSLAAWLAPQRPALGSALHFVLHSLSKHWQRLKWEKVEAAEVAAMETSIFTLAGWRQVSGGSE